MSESNLAHEGSGPVFLTRVGYDRLQKELDRLMVEKRPEIAERIRESQQHGEFSEDNNELDEVKFEQAIVESRISELRAVLANFVLIENEMIPTDAVGIGSLVTVTDLEHHETFQIRIVSSIEADPAQDLISNESPLGRALMENKAKSEISFEAPNGRRKVRIEAISA